jgi:starvation-inducible DNA-binding protein
MIGKIEPYDALKVALADTYVFSVKVQGYHWNVTGPHFSEYHKFFGELYSEVNDAVDVIAESIRTFDAFSPGSMKRFLELTTIEEANNIPDSLVMISKLAADNERVIASITAAYELCEKHKHYAVSNMLQDRLTAHQKHGWMLRSFIKA